MADNEPKFNVVFSTALLEKLASETPANRERREQQRREADQRRREQAERAAAQRAAARERENAASALTPPSTSGQRHDARLPQQSLPAGFGGGVPPGVPGFLNFERQQARQGHAVEAPPKDLGAIKKALAESERVGGLLLKREEDEMQKVRDLAHRLHDQEYKAPSRAPPCVNESEECLRCYQENQQDPLRCASMVQRFTQCSRAAQQAFVAAGVSPAPAR